MIYGQKEYLDDRLSTIVSSGDTIKEYDSWVDGISNIEPSPENKFNEMYASELLDHMTRDEFSGFKRPVVAFYHSSEEEREEFIALHGIKILQSEESIDAQLDMIYQEKVSKEQETVDKKKMLANAMGEEYKEKTIAELAGVDVYDPWDNRSDEQKELDKAKNEQYEALRKAGKISDESFGGVDELKSAKEDKPSSGIHIDSIKGKLNPDGSVDFADIFAKKNDGPVDEAMKIAKEEAEKSTIEKKTGGFSIFSPEDFADALDGTSSVKDTYEDELKKALDDAQKDLLVEEEALEKKALDSGSFRSSDLTFSDEMPLGDLPRELIDIMREKVSHLPKTVPYDIMKKSSCGHGIIIPSGFHEFVDIPSVLHTMNLNKIGHVFLGRQMVNIYEKEKDYESYVLLSKIENEKSRFMVLIIK